MAKEEDLHIKILKYAAGRKDGFTFSELRKDLSLTEAQAHFLRNEIRGADMIAPTGQYRIEGNRDFENEVVMLSFESRFKLLQFIALEEARTSGTRALFFAGISVLIAAAGVYFQVQQTRISESQSVSARVKQAMNVEAALTLCSVSSDAVESGLFEVETGKAVSCPQVLETFGK